MGLRYYNSPMADFLFDCLFKSQESFSKFSNLTYPYNMRLSAILNSGAILIAATVCVMEIEPSLE